MITRHRRQAEPGAPEGQQHGDQGRELHAEDRFPQAIGVEVLRFKEIVVELFQHRRLTEGDAHAQQHQTAGQNDGSPACVLQQSRAGQRWNQGQGRGDGQAVVGQGRAGDGGSHPAPTDRAPACDAHQQGGDQHGCQGLAGHPVLQKVAQQR